MFVQLLLVSILVVGLEPAKSPDQIPQVPNFQQKGGSIKENPFPQPTAVGHFQLEQVEIDEELLYDVLSHTFYTHTFIFEPVNRHGIFNMQLVNFMLGHNFTLFALVRAKPDFLGFIWPIDIYSEVRFDDCILPWNFFDKTIVKWFPSAKMMNLTNVQIGNGIKNKKHGVGIDALQFLISGKIEPLRRLIIQGFFKKDKDKIKQVLEQLGCPEAVDNDYVQLDKESDDWKC